MKKTKKQLSENEIQRFKVGDIVKIKEGTRYSCQSKKEGVIKSIKFYKKGDPSVTNYGFWYEVFFNGGYQNIYQNTDLDLVDELLKFIKEQEEYNKNK